MKNQPKMRIFIFFCKKVQTNVIVFFFLLQFTPCSSQEINKIQLNDLVNMSIEELMDIKIVTASKHEQRFIEAPATMEIITSEQIRQRGYVDVEQLLHDLPGFDISRGNGTIYSQIYQRGYRSNNTDRTLLLVDGIEENDLWKGAAWISRQYPISNIKRVEIVYGPASTIYGANAFVGVINIITKDPEDIIKEGQHFGVISRIAYGTWNTRYTDITVAARYEPVSFTLTGRVYKSDEMDLSKFQDFDYNLDAYNVDYYKNRLGTNDETLINLAMRLDREGYYNVSHVGFEKPHYSNPTDDWLIHAKLKIQDFTLGFQTWKRDEGYGAWYRDDYNLYCGGRWIPANTFLYVKYETKLNEKLTFSSFTRFKNHVLDGDSRDIYYIGYFNGEYGLDDLIAVDSVDVASPAQSYWDDSWWYVRSRQLRTEFNTVYTPSEKWRLVAGLEYRSSHIQGTYVSSLEKNPSERGFPRDKAGTGLPGGNHYEHRDIGFYTQATYKPKKNLSLVLGGRIDDNKIRKTGGYGTVLNPKIAFVYSPSGFVAKAIYSTAFKDADNWTKYSTTSGRELPNPTLEPERVKNLETSLGWYVTKNLFADITAYHSWCSDVVGTATVAYGGGTTTQHRAIGSLQIRGTQIRAKYKNSNYDAYLYYTYSDPQNTEGESDIRIGDIAGHRINFGINARYFDHLNLNLRMNYVGERKTGEETTISNNPFDVIDAYTVFHGAITYKNIIGGISLQLAINNVFNTEYFHPGVRSADGVYYAARMPQNRRNFILKLMYDF
ncbi:TonB-dependent receptor [bacterium]|nr:TonB-dependent receptor [bacterium]